MSGRKRLLVTEALALIALVGLTGCGRKKQPPPPAASSAPAAPEPSTAPAAHRVPSNVPPDPCRATCNQHWLLNHRRDRFCGFPSSERKPWKTPQCAEGTLNFEDYAKGHHQCDCATPFPKRSMETEPERDTAVCNATCDTYSRLRYRMHAVCYRFPFQKLYDDPECRGLEDQLFSLDHERVLDCRCHSFGYDKPLPTDLCDQACVRFRKAANRYERLCHGNDHHFVQKYNTEGCLDAAGDFDYEERVTEHCGCAGEGAAYPTPKGPKRDTKECRTLCDEAGTLNNILYRSCFAITFDKKNYEKPECYDIEESFFYEYPWSDLERCGCRFWPRVPSTEADGAPPPGYPLDQWRGEAWRTPVTAGAL